METVQASKLAILLQCIENWLLMSLEISKENFTLRYRVREAGCACAFKIFRPFFFVSLFLIIRKQK